MVQFNLLPSVKLEYIKATRTKRMVITIAIIASAVALGILLLLFINVNFVQKKHITNLTNDINNKSEELASIENIDKVLTVQNQLSVLTQLHEQKPAADRVLGYLSKVTPQSASISESTVNFEENTMSINGTADSLINVNKFVDTLKFTKYTVDDDPAQQNAFSEIVLASFNVDADGVTYQIDLKFDPVIFDNSKKIELVVPAIVSTRSQTEKPTDLFQSQPESTQPAAGQ